jgi:hypothetical protein
VKQRQTATLLQEALEALLAIAEQAERDRIEAAELESKSGPA